MLLGSPLTTFPFRQPRLHIKEIAAFPLERTVKVKHKGT